MPLCIVCAPGVKIPCPALTNVLLVGPATDNAVIGCVVYRDGLRPKASYGRYIGTESISSSKPTGGINLKPVLYPGNKGVAFNEDLRCE